MRSTKDPISFNELFIYSRKIYFDLTNYLYIQRNNYFDSTDYLIFTKELLSFNKLFIHSKNQLISLKKIFLCLIEELFLFN